MQLLSQLNNYTNLQMPFWAYKLKFYSLKSF